MERVEAGFVHAGNVEEEGRRGWRRETEVGRRGGRRGRRRETEDGRRGERPHP
jgi:hypothetical protein